MLRRLARETACLLLVAASQSALIDIACFFADLYGLDGPVGLDAGATALWAPRPPPLVAEVSRTARSEPIRLPADVREVVALARVGRARDLEEVDALYGALSAYAPAGARFSLGVRYVATILDERVTTLAFHS